MSGMLLTTATVHCLSENIEDRLYIINAPLDLNPVFTFHKFGSHLRSIVSKTVSHKTIVGISMNSTLRLDLPFSVSPFPVLS
jgi:hypothetical protein